MKRFLSVALFLVLVMTLHAESTLYLPLGWSLGTRLPAQPEVSEQKTPVPDGEILELRAGVKEGDELYVVERALLPIPLLPERYNAVYVGGKEFMQQKNPRVLKSEEKIMICGHEGRRYVLVSNDGQRVTDHRAVIVGSEIFEFIYERPASKPPSPTAEIFFSEITSKN